MRPFCSSPLPKKNARVTPSVVRYGFSDALWPDAKGEPAQDPTGDVRLGRSETNGERLSRENNFYRVGPQRYYPIDTFVWQFN